MGGAKQSSGTVSRRSRIAAVLVVLSLLAFTTIRTSPIFGPETGSSLSKTHTKQRQFYATDFCAPMPVVVSWPPPAEEHHLVSFKQDELPRECFFPRCSDLPPPTA